jgi:two-component system response regulator AtoC
LIEPVTAPVAPDLRVLVIDDDEDLARTLRRALTSVNIEADHVTDPRQALAELEQRASYWDVIVLDLNLPAMPGVEALRRIREMGVATSVVMLTGDDRAASAAECMRAGAFYYLTKPFALAELTGCIRGAARQTALARGRQSTSDGADMDILIGKTPEMRKVRAAIEQLAHSTVSILILGESGTGKELVARALHRHSPRATGPFVAVNCGAIPETLIDSELFGHSRGAFTGAATARPGVFAEADGGTIFLDEIGEMPLSVQPRLLRVLQEGEVRPLGAAPRSVDVRVIAATHVDLQEAVDARRFRADLFYRLNVVCVTLPALRERIDDLPALAAHFLRKHAGDRKVDLTPAALERLIAYPWPGNVRELENALLHAIALTQGDCIEVEALPRRVVSHLAEAGHGLAAGTGTNWTIPRARLDAEPPLWADLPLVEAKRRVASEFERNYLLFVIEKAHGSVSEAARVAGLDRANFRRLLQRHAIDPEAFRRRG